MKTPHWSACLLLIPLAGCGSADSSAAVHETYRFLESGGFSYEEMPAIRASLPYERIELDRWSTWGFGASVTTLWLDGRAEKSRSTEHPTGLRGTIDLNEFGSLCYLLEHSRFEALEPLYDWGGFDADIVTVRLWPAGSAEPLEVADIGRVGPIELWGIHAAIDGVASRIEWEPIAAEGLQAGGER